MNTRLVMASMTVLFGGLCFGQADDVVKKDDKELLQGVWVLKSIESDGRESNTVRDKIIVKGDEWKVHQGPKFKFKIDAAKNPKQLDLVGSQRTPAKIYEIDGNTLRICQSERVDGERPTKFKSGFDVLLLVYTRGAE